jgi:uncharacterized membrane protein
MINLFWGWTSWKSLYYKRTRRHVTKETNVHSQLNVSFLSQTYRCTRLSSASRISSNAQNVTASLSGLRRSSSIAASVIVFVGLFRRSLFFMLIVLYRLNLKRYFCTVLVTGMCVILVLFTYTVSGSAAVCVCVCVCVCTQPND